MALRGAEAPLFHGIPQVQRLLLNLYGLGKSEPYPGLGKTEPHSADFLDAERRGQQAEGQRDG
jgi:hypothetical protein